MSIEDVDRKALHEVLVCDSGERIVLGLRPGEHQSDFNISQASNEQRRWIATNFVAAKKREPGDPNYDEWNA